MGSLTNLGKVGVLVALTLSFSASRVCFSTVANYTQNTAIGLCSQAILQTLKVGTNGTIAYVTTTTTPQSTVRSLLPTFCNRRVAYPYLEPYLAVVGAGTESPLAAMLSTPTVRANFVRALVAFVKSYPNCVGIFIDFSGLSTSQAYNNLFRWIIKGISPGKMILGLSMYARAFNVSRVSQFGAQGTAISTVASYCDALLFSSQFGIQTNSAGESISSSSSMAYVFNSFAAIDIKLNFARSNSLGGVALFSLNTAGANAELLRYVTSVIAPTPPAGYTYPPASRPTCGVPITFPQPGGTTTQPGGVTGGTTRAGGEEKRLLLEEPQLLLEVLEEQRPLLGEPQLLLEEPQLLQEVLEEQRLLQE
uniref:GH18 domain-containing protein n=1 Tax=Anopheles culicifacies TaxID=139723 RepID=A0A182MR61_9DIPT